MPIQDKTAAAARLPWGLEAKDVAALAFLLLAGSTYFGLYYDHGFNIADEGSVVLITKRLLEGERPFLDVSLGYGLLWYYPLVLLFKVTGVHFIAARIFFLAMAMATALLAFLTIRRQTRRRWLAAAFALPILLVPGTLHKTFIPLIVVANMLCLPLLDRHRRSLSGTATFAAGLVAAVSYHIRPDLGLFAGLVLTTTLAAHPFLRAPTWPLRTYELGRLSLFLGVATLVPTLPLTLIAYRQGFLGSFQSVLYQPIGYSIRLIRELFTRVLGLVLTFSQTRGAPLLTATVEPEVAAQAGRPLPRIPLAAIWEEGPQRIIALYTYLPLLTLAIIVASVGFRMLKRRLQSRSVVGGDTVGILGLAGLAYAAFPQFFLFRPDVDHLSQFMPGYVVLLGVCLGKCFLPEREPAKKRTGTLLAGIAAAGMIIIHVGFYVGLGLRSPEAGSIALARGRSERFIGANGVDVAVTPQEKKLFTAASRIIEENTNDNDAVLCFPYCPGFNVMTNRRTFMRRLYVDDSLLILEPDWQQRMIGQIDTEEPPLIIIQDWAVNSTDISHFKKWATQVMTHISSRYVVVESLADFQFYLRHNRLNDTAPLADEDPHP